MSKIASLLRYNGQNRKGGLHYEEKTLAFPDVYFCGGAMDDAVPNQMGRLHIYLDRDLKYCILVTDHEIYCALNTAAIDKQELLRIIGIYPK